MKSIKILSLLTIVTFTLALISACDKDELIIPKPAVFNMSFSSFNLCDGDELTITPSVNTAESCPGLEILEAEYYWDGKLISRQNKSPFTLKHKIEGQALGEHNVTIRLTYGGDGYLRMQLDHGFDYKVNVVEDLHIYTNPIFSLGKDVKNGEAFRCEAVLDKERTRRTVTRKAPLLRANCLIAFKENPYRFRVKPIRVFW